MGDLGGAGRVVVVVKPRYSSRGLCTCGWVGKPRLLLSSAKVDALIHAAHWGCEPAVPLIQPGVMLIMERRGVLAVDGRQGSGQPPQVDQRQGRLRATRRHPSSNRRGRAVPHSVNLLPLIDIDVTADLLQLTHTHIISNVFACGTRLPASRLGRYRMGYSPALGLFRKQG